MAETRPKGYPKLKEYTPTRFMLPECHYDKARADRAVNFIEQLRHTKGKWAGKRFWLLPWQEQIIRDVFGIIDENGNRQFKTAYVEIGKKNGKSELAAAVALYLLYADNEPSAEVYGAAADRQQASIVFDVANQMVQMTPALMKRSKIMGATKRIVNYSNAGFYQVLSVEVGTKHGLNVSGLVLDEVHAQPNRKLYDVLTKGSGDAREQPLFFLITTAGTDKESICYELHMKALDLLKGRKIDHTFYPVVYGLTDEDDWHLEENWYKANPSLDRSESGELFYIYHAYTDEVPGENNKDIIFRKDEIFHIPGLGFNGLIGFSPIAMMKNSLGTTLAVERYGASFFKNGAQPSGVLEHPGVLKDPARVRDNWQAAYGGAANAHRVAVLEEGMSYKAISLPPEDSQFLSTRQFGVEEICRIFRVPPHMVQSMEHATFSNIEHQSIDFVVHTLTPWLVRFEQSIIKDLLLEDEQDDYFPKFNVDGLLRGDYQSRMNGYAVGISNGFLSPNDVHRLENMDLIPADQGGDDYYLNGGYVKLKDAGIAQQNKAAAMQQNQPKEEESEEESKQDNTQEEPPDSENRRSENTPKKSRKGRTRR